jgi:membrane protein required for colicin V production
MNWLDFLILAIIVVAIVLGIVKGLVKQAIGLAAVIAGLILAALYYETMAAVFAAFVHNALLSRFLGFLLIFVVVLVAGSVLAWLITKAMIGPLAFINRAFGGAFGLVKAVLICGILVFAMTAFEIGRPALRMSVLAPFCLGVTRAVVHMIPRDLRSRFDSSYEEIRKRGGRYGEKI